MSNQRGILLLTIPPEAADRFDWVAQRYELTQEQVAVAAIVAISNLIEDTGEAGDRMRQFMDLFRAAQHRSLDVRLSPLYQGAD